MYASLVFIMLVTLVAENEGISSHGGIFGKKRNKMPSRPSSRPNRFLCPGCLEKLNGKPSEKDFVTSENVKVHCVKGDKGDKGDIGLPGQQGTCDKEQIDAVVKPLQAKLEALISSYTTEIARLRNEVYSMKSKFMRTIGSKENPAKSCKEIYEQEKYSPSGVYYLNPTGKQEGLTRVYCFMEEDETCPAGSTLVLKIDGSKDTFNYLSPLWTNKEVYAEENGLTLFDTKETKLATYWSVPFTRICISMRKLDSLNAESLVIDETSTSLYDIIADGKYRATKGGREIWESLLPGSQLQRGCFLEGFNAHGTQKGSAGARIGVIASDQSNCTSTHSLIGFGTEGGACATSGEISCGACNTDKNIPTLGSIFVY